MEKSVTIKMDEHNLSGVLHVPDNSNNDKYPVVIICHGFIGSKVGQHRIFVHTARQLCQAGVAVLRFDYIGCGESTGEYKDTTVIDQVRQTQQIIDYAAGLAEVDERCIILLGHSLGGGIASVAAGMDQRIAKLILWSPVGFPQQDILGILGEALFNECLSRGTANYQGFVLGRNFLLSLADLAPTEKIKDFQGDILILHGDNDIETPVRNTVLYEEVLRSRAKGRFAINIISNADHTYSSPVWEEAVIQGTRKGLEKFTLLKTK